MNTPKNTKSEEIKQQVTKVGAMKDKKIDCTCKEHHKHKCYFGKRPCDKCKGRNCTPQEQKSLLDSILSWEELKDEEVPHDYEEMIVAVGRNNLRQQIRNRLIKELS